MPILHLPSILLAIPRNPVTAVGLPLALGVLSGLPTAQIARGRWYNSLYVPPGRPPHQVFPIVWPLLYISMGYASHLAVKALDTSMSESKRADLSLGLALYYVQLGANCIWTPLFFSARQTGWALVDSVFIAGTTFYMTKLLHDATASSTTWALLPYCAWVTFATYLNGGIWWLNRGRGPELDRA